MFDDFLVRRSIVKYRVSVYVVSSKFHELIPSYNYSISMNDTEKEENDRKKSIANNQIISIKNVLFLFASVIRSFVSEIRFFRCSIYQRYQFLSKSRDAEHRINT